LSFVKVDKSRDHTHNITIEPETTMTDHAPTATDDPFDLGPVLTREERLARLRADFEKGGRQLDDGVPVLSEDELLVVAELLGEFNATVNPGDVDSDGWGLLATQMASRIYSRLKI
jgi:hypothetical protein